MLVAVTKGDKGVHMGGQHDSRHDVHDPRDEDVGWIRRVLGRIYRELTKFVNRAPW